MRWPEGFMSAGVSAGIKSSGLDLGVLAALEPVQWAGVFTENAAAAAPVKWCRDLVGQRVRALVVNSGNANACTGPDGDLAVRETVSSLASALGCDAEQILCASTGPIGVPLPVDALVGSIPATVGSLTSDLDDFAEAILTTDTRPKVSVADIGDARIVGVAKGAAMIAPSMATMLAFITTDAQLEDEAQALKRAVDKSFNLISIDACESTNDSVFLLSSGRRGPVSEDLFAKALEEVCRDLADQIVSDAEGGTKVVELEIAAAAHRDEAIAFGRAVAGSDLWRAAVHGGDPNWGRVVSALGTVDRTLDMNGVSIWIGTEPVFSKGAPAGSPQSAAAQMQGDRFRVRCELGRGDVSETLLTTDLSPDYVRLNAEGST